VKNYVDTHGQSEVAFAFCHLLGFQLLNVVEQWNSANSFIFYGKNSEIATNRLEDQEIAVLSLHLLQICLVYINTLMMQQILSERQWLKLMQKDDFRALTPLRKGAHQPLRDFPLGYG
jgi:TnpA family transposase